MNISSPFLSVRSVIVIGVAILAVQLLLSSRAQTPDCSHCAPPPNNGSVANAQASAWSRGSTVTVYIDPAFSPQQQQAIRNAFSNWSNAGGSGVSFQFSSTPVSGANTFTVNQQQPSLGPGYRGETGGTTSGGHRYMRSLT